MESYKMKAFTCNDCGSCKLIIVEKCHRCHGTNIEKGQQMFCYTCGYTGFEK